VKLLRTIRLDPSDTFVFERAAEPGEWAVPGAFAFAHLDPAALQGKARAAFRSGFLGIDTLGWSTLVQIVEASETDRAAAVNLLAQRLIERFGAPDLATALPAAEEEVAFAAALSHGPDLLVLDEPTSGVGPIGRADLWETIHAEADRGVGVLVTTHHMDEAEQCDRLVFLSGGREKFAGTVNEILFGQETLELSPDDPASALALLELAGLPVLPAGDRLRVPGSSVDTIRAVLGDGVSVTLTPSTLEEAFMTLVLS